MFEKLSNIQNEIGEIDVDKLSTITDDDISEMEKELSKEIVSEFSDIEKPLMINIEGGDGSGKETQTRYLEILLNCLDIKTKRIDFPDYEDRTPEMLILKDILSGKYGSISKLNPMFRASLYAADRYNHKERITKALKENKVVILDRYNASNVYNADVDDDKFGVFCQVSEVIEYVLFGMPVPSSIMYLESSPSFVENILKERSKTGSTDEFEKRKGFQDIVRDRYHRYLNYRDEETNLVIPCYHTHCYDSNYKQLTIRQVNILVLYNLYITIINSIGRYDLGPFGSDVLVTEQL